MPRHSVTFLPGGTRLRTAVIGAMKRAEGARRVSAGFAATGGVTRGAELIEQQILPARIRSSG